VETYSRHPNDSRLKKLWGLIISMKIILNKIFQKIKNLFKVCFFLAKSFKSETIEINFLEFNL